MRFSGPNPTPKNSKRTSARVTQPELFRQVLSLPLCASVPQLPLCVGLCVALSGCQGTTQKDTEVVVPVATPVAEVAPVVSAPPRASDAKEAERSKAAEFVGTVGKTEVKREQMPTELVDLRIAQHGGYERMVFQFKERVPGYRVEYIDKPVRNCGEGRVIAVAGESWLEVNLYPTNAHTEEGQPTLPMRERQLGLDVMIEAKQTCDFEAVVTWVLGLSHPNAYRVLELQDPPRLVVDVKR